MARELGIFEIVRSNYRKLIACSLTCYLVNIPSLIFSLYLAGWALDIYFPGFDFDRTVKVFLGMGYTTEQSVQSALYQELFLYFLFIAIFISFHLTVVGPFNSGLTQVYKSIILNEPVFLLSDFKEAVKKNFKQTLSHSLVAFGLTCLLLLVSYLYGELPLKSWMTAILRSCVFVLFFMHVIVQPYVNLLLLEEGMTLRKKYIIALQLAAGTMPSNFLSLIGSLVSLLIVPLFCYFIVPGYALVVSTVYLILFGTALSQILFYRNALVNMNRYYGLERNGD